MPSLSSTAKKLPTGVSLAKRTDRLGSKSMPMARLSNTYLQDTAKLVGWLKLVQIVVVVAMVIMVGLLANFSSTHYRIFGTTADGKLTTLPPIDKDLGENTVLLWVMDVVNSSMTMGFHDYNLRLQEIRPFFTDRGWESFNRYQRTTIDNMPSIRSMLENDRLVIWPRPAKPPQVIRKEVVAGVFTYELRSEVTITRTTVTGTFVSVVLVDLSVERVSTDINPSGLAISRWRVAKR